MMNWEEVVLSEGMATSNTDTVSVEWTAQFEDVSEAETQTAAQAVQSDTSKEAQTEGRDVFEAEELRRERELFEKERKEFEEIREKFQTERVRYRKEMDELNRRTVLERKRLREENLFFEKKMEILQDGFRRLEEDRREFEKYKRIESERRTSRYSVRDDISDEEVVALLFRGIDNPLALRKRYKDLLKIYHPDNLFGDEALVQVLNREYIRRRKEEA